VQRKRIERDLVVIYVAGGLILTVYSGLVLSVISYFETMIKVSHRLLGFVPEPLLS
jgi:hypothetical protein